MAEEKKESKSKINKKNIFLFIGLILISGTAAFYFIKNKPVEKKESFDVDPIEESSNNNSIVTSDSILSIDSTNLNQVEDEELKIKYPNRNAKKKASRFSLENNPNYWVIVKGSNSDTSFYLLKNKKTGTKLSNKFYNKDKATKELKNLQNILSK